MADNTRRLSGNLIFTIDGTAYAVVSDVIYRLSKVDRETKTGMDGVHGYGEKWQACYIAAKLRDRNGIKAGDFTDMTNVTVEIRTANGKRVVGTGMWNTKAVEVDTTEGTFDVQFDGSTVTEQ